MKTLFSENLGFWVETEGLGPNLGSTVSLRIEYFFKIETFLKLYNGTLDFWQIWQIVGTYGGYLANFWYLRGYLANFWYLRGYLANFWYLRGVFGKFLFPTGVFGKFVVPTGDI